jgi:hypothetical protein
VVIYRFALKHITTKEMNNEMETIEQELVGKYVITRSRAGIFAGTVKKKEGQDFVLENCRRLRYWKGAATISELSQKGARYPDECEFPAEVPTEWLADVFEVLVCSPEAQEALKNVKVWTMFDKEENKKNN